MFKQNPVSTKKIQNIITNARKEQFPWEAFPATTKSWLKAMALSRNTKPEFILLAAIGGFSTILGPKTKIIIRKSSNKETVLHKKKGYEELPGIFLTILSEPGAGKTTAFNVAIQDPLL